MTATLITQSAALKQYFNNTTIEYQGYHRVPLYTLLRKDPKALGKEIRVPLQYANGGGRSVTFATAQANVSGAGLGEFIVKRVKDYSVARIENELIEASQGDGSLVDAAKLEMESALRNLKLSMNQKLWRNGSGAIGRRASISSNTITLTTPSDGYNFEVNQVLVAAATETGAIRTGSAKVVKVNRGRSTTTVEVDSAAGISSFADNDYLFVQGDAQNGATDPIAMRGLDAWLPTSAPGGSDSFWGLNRSVDVTKLAGHRENGTGKTIRDTVVDLCEEICAAGGMPDLFIGSHRVAAALKKEMGSDIRYQVIQGHSTSKALEGKLGFKGISIDYDKGSGVFVTDPHAPIDRLYALTSETWKLASAGPAPHFFDNKGKMVTVHNADSLEIRCVMYANATCDAPGYSGVAYNLPV